MTSFYLKMSDGIGANDLNDGKHGMQQSGATNVPLTYQNQNAVIHLQEIPIVLEMKELTT